MAVDYNDPKVKEEMDQWAEEFKRERQKHLAEKRSREKRIEEAYRQQYIKEHGIDPNVLAQKYKKEPPKWDSPYTLDNWSATVLYIIVMVGGSIFHGNWVIWIVATIIYFRHLTRHNR